MQHFEMTYGSEISVFTGVFTDFRTHFRGVMIVISSLSCRRRVVRYTRSEAIISITTSFPCGLRGFHVYQDIWKPLNREVLNCIHERKNSHDRCAVAATKRPPGRIYQGRFQGSRVFLFEGEERLKYW